MTLQDTQSQETADATLTDQSGGTQAEGTLQQTDTSGIGVNGEQKPERTYTQAEVTQIQARADQREAQGRHAIAEASLQVDVAQAESRERLAQEADNRRVEDGELTQSDANRRSEGRIQNAADSIRSRSQQEKEVTAMEGVRRETDQMARMLKTNEAAKKFGVPLDDLVGWVQKNNPDHPREIDLQAREMALSKREASVKGNEHYDGNKQGTRGMSLDGMSPQEKIALALSRDK
jgi:hypothetical protein